MLAFRTVKCVTLSEDYYYFVVTVWPWVDLTVFALLPLVIHIVCNVFIVKNVVSSFRQARRSRGTGIAADTRYRSAVDTAKSSSSGLILSSVDTTKSARSGQMHTNVDTTKSASSGQTHTSVDTTKRSASNGQILNSVDTANSAPSGQTHTSVDTTKSAPCGLFHTSADSFVGGSSSIGVNCTVCNRECTCEDRSLARLKDCSCKSECSSQDGKLASMTSSFGDAESSSKGRNVLSLNGGFCGAECSSTDRNVANLNDGLCHAECSSKERIFSQNSSATTLNHAALTRGCTSLDGDAEDNATDVGTQGPVAKDSETCPLGRVQINGLNAPKDATPFSERTKQHEGQDEIGSTSEGSEAKFIKDDSRGKTTSAGKDPGRVSTLEPSSAPLRNSNGSDSQAMELTVSQTDPPTANSVHTKCKPKEKSGCVKASVESAVGRQRSSTAASPNPTCARDDSRVSSMTVMLVTVSSVFCVTTVPISLYTIINWILVEKGYDYPHREVSITLILIALYTIINRILVEREYDYPHREVRITRILITLYTIISWVLVERGYDYPHRELRITPILITLYTIINWILVEKEYDYPHREVRITPILITLYTIINWILVEKGYDYPHREVSITLILITLYTVFNWILVEKGYDYHHREVSITLILITLYTIFNWILVEREYDYPHREVRVTLILITLYTIINWILVEKGYDYPYREVRITLILIIQTQKGSNKRLLILRRTHSMQVFGEIPFIKPQNHT